MKKFIERALAVASLLVVLATTPAFGQNNDRWRQEQAAERARQAQAQAAQARADQRARDSAAQAANKSGNDNARNARERQASGNRNALGSASFPSPPPTSRLTFGPRPGAGAAQSTPTFNRAVSPAQNAGRTLPAGTTFSSGGISNVVRKPTPAEEKRGFTGRFSADGRALVKFQGRVYLVPASRIGARTPQTSTGQTALATGWSPPKQASISAEIQKLALAGGASGGGRAATQQRTSEAKNARTSLINNVERGNSFASNVQYLTVEALERGLMPPHSEGSGIRKFVTAETIKFVRLHRDIDKPGGRFLVRAKEIEHLNSDPDKIKKYLGIDFRPNFISDVDVPPNTEMDVSVIAAQPDLGKYKSTGFQYILIEDIPNDSFKNTRPIRLNERTPAKP